MITIESYLVKKFLKCLLMLDLTVLTVMELWHMVGVPFVRFQDQEMLL